MIKSTSKLGFNMKTKMILASILGVALSTHAMAEQTDISNHVYSKVGYTHVKTGDAKLHGYSLVVGDRIGLTENQSVRIEGEGLQTSKHNGVKVTQLGVKANYEYAIAAGDNLYLIPTAGVGYRQTKLKTDGFGSDTVKTIYGEVGVKGQTNVGNIVVMPELAYQKDLQTKYDGEKLKRGDNLVVGVSLAKELSEDYAVTFGVKHEVGKNHALSDEKLHQTKVQFGIDF